MDQDDSQCVLVTGGSGLIGKAIAHEVDKSLDSWTKRGLKFIFVSSREADLTDIKQTCSLFREHKPSYVIHLAAKVGGLFANMNDNDTFFRVNQAINNNVLRCASEYRVKKCISCLSTCIFPDKIEYPLDETKVRSTGDIVSRSYGRLCNILNLQLNYLLRFIWDLRTVRIPATPLPSDRLIC